MHFEKLPSSNNPILLTNAYMDKKLQVALVHSIMGISTITDDIHHIPRLGVDIVMIVEVHPKSLFITTTAKNTPKLSVQLKSPQQNSLIACQSTNYCKNKIKYVVFLIPTPVQTIQSTYISLNHIFIKIVNQIKLDLISICHTYSNRYHISSSCNYCKSNGLSNPSKMYNEVTKNINSMMYYHAI